MKVQRIFSLIGLLSLFLNACAQTVDLTQAITVTAAPRASQSPTHTPTFLPVSSPTPGETATAVPSATTEIRAFTVEEACVQISANRQDLAGEGLGKLVLERDETDAEIFRACYELG